MKNYGHLVYGLILFILLLANLNWMSKVEHAINLCGTSAADLDGPQEYTKRDWSKLLK